ncbi:stage III sporulation protein AE [Desulfitobacterium sp. LBE]|uniref:Stage III sporulation protein AE n=5 Tax=root TaxID=1 RepID=Q24UY2_DESHY|nr:MULTISPECIES: stage III sporulation protein AE [Desulfitobacterium]ACL21530.1 stage III sporulation protein AE [Desulfitobacterium hafniense DCB-2]EHL07564.1 stage III sporulation protein AE [Desulfitobacterium hafniense DP7]KTE89799.1 stage III sporulation protein AE [Desulfitobacterium hafniense]MEA5023220.1 stage III sporulation protein AE [Desulfitobacterium hafniense]TWH60680.1 stage III sporulation protein AE [Desulfitobacterium sp. LBE]
MQRVIIIFLFFFFIGNGTTPSLVYGAEEMSEPTADLAAQVDLTEVRGFLEQIDRDVQESLPNFSLAKFFDDLRQGNINLHPVEIGKTLLALLGKEILESAPLIGKLLILAVLTAVLQQLQSAFSGEVGKMAQILAYLVLMGIALATFQIAMNLASDSIQTMTGFMQTLLPVMMTMLVAMGNLTTAALFKPIVLGSLTFLATLIKTVALPLFFLAAVLKLFNHISSEFKLSRLAGLLEFTGKLSLGIILTVFIGVMAVQGVTGGVADGVVLRTAKYSADLIPVVGKFFKDAVELVVTSGLLLKNALGIVAIIALALICLGPVVKLVAMILVFKISSALIEPLGQKELADTLQEMSKSLIFIFASVASVAIMFFMAIAVVVGSGNLTVMLR